MGVATNERVQRYRDGLRAAGLRPMQIWVPDTRRPGFDATIRNIELIGEAATHVPEAVRLASPAIPWRMIIATRNQLIHGYLGIDNDTLWSIVNTDIPALWSALQKLKTTLPT